MHMHVCRLEKLPLGACEGTLEEGGPKVSYSVLLKVERDGGGEEEEDEEDLRA